MGVQVNTIHGKTRDEWTDDLGKTREKTIFYDVYRCEDRIRVRNGISAKSAAKFAGVSENFVVMTSIKPAQNQYGHLATMSGYYFARHDDHEEPVFFDLPKQPGHKPGVPKVFKIRPETMNELIRYHGYETAQQFCERNKLSYDTLMTHVTQGINTRPATSKFAVKLCKLLGVRIMDIYCMRFVKE